MRNAMRNANGKTLRVVDGPDKLSYASTRRASLELCVALVAQVDRYVKPALRREAMTRNSL